MAKSILQISLLTEFQFIIRLVEILINIQYTKHSVLNLFYTVITEYLTVKSEQVSLLRQPFCCEVLILLPLLWLLCQSFLLKQIYRILSNFQYPLHCSLSSFSQSLNGFCSVLFLH